MLKQYKICILYKQKNQVLIKKNKKTLKSDLIELILKKIDKIK